MIDKRVLAAVVDFAAICAEENLSDDAILMAVHWAQMMNKPEEPKKPRIKKEKAYTPLTKTTIKDLKDLTDGLDKISSEDIVTALGLPDFHYLTPAYVEAMRHLGFARVESYDFGNGKKQRGYVRVK